MLELLAAIANRSDVRVDTDKLEALSNARERVASSKTSLSRARTALSSAETAASVATQRLELAEAGSRSEDITAATAAEEEARAKIDELTERIEEGTVTAPYSGVITDVTVESGELAQAGSPVMTVIDDTSWLARGEAASRLAPALDEGQPVTITPTGYTRSFAGELATVMPALRSGSGALVLEVRTNALPNTTKAGQAATVRIPLSQQGDSLYFVPREFVGFSYDGPFVETVGGQRYPVDVRSSTEETFSVAAPELRASTTIIVP
jgi:multidrug resistance efflux pump